MHDDPGALTKAVSPALDALLAQCDREPIQFPGAVQPHGAMVAIEPTALRVTHASANLDAFLDRGAAQALGQPLNALFGDAIAALLPAAAQARRANPSAAGLDAGFSGARIRLLPFISTAGTICIDLLHEPLPDPAAAALIQAQRVIQSLRLSRTSSGLCRIAVNDIRRITGFDRVMVYRFDDDGSGDVVAEDHGTGVVSFLGLKYPASDIPQQARRLYMLQRIRVIPDVDAAPVALLTMAGSGATELDLSASWLRAVSPIHLQYLRHMAVRATAVVSLIVAGRLWGMLVCHHDTPWRISADQRALLDLVGQVMSVMLGALTEGEHNANRSQRQRALGAITAAVANPQDTIAAAFAASASDLVNLVPAHGAIVTIGDRMITVGHTPQPAALQRIMAALTGLAADDLTAATVLGDIVPDEPAQTREATAQGPAPLREASTESPAPLRDASSESPAPGRDASTESPALLSDASTESPARLDGFAGVLLLPLPNCAGGSIAWFRRELNLTVQWAGNPAKRGPDPVTGRLEPRLSFAAWNEQVRGRSAPWTPADLGAARELRRCVDEALVRRHEADLMERLRDCDPLTGLLNRTAAENRLKAIAGNPVPPHATLAILNVDRFRKVNEMLGNQAGDALLVQIARRLQVAVEPGDPIARLGTDEFGVLSGRAGAAELAARVFAVFAQPFEIARQTLQMHASVGVADRAVVGNDGFGLLHCAETAMRQAKSAGGNGIAHFVPERRGAGTRDLVIEQSLDEALLAHREQFQLAFQPIVDVASGALRSWEVLVRWQHPTLGNITPDRFIPIAERCGLIVGLGALVLDEALRHLVEVPPSAEAGERDIYVSVNVSPVQLTRGGFAGDLAAQLHAHGIAPSRLCVEVTEGVFANQQAVEAIRAIRDLGVLVAVDDFGIGYSSLSTLQRLPADVVKLDRSFLPDHDGVEWSDWSFLAAVVALAHTVGLKVVIEGVETQGQLDVVVAAGVDAIQGYFVARPMPGEVAMALTCQRHDERSWTPWLEAARRFAAGARPGRVAAGAAVAAQTAAATGPAGSAPAFPDIPVL